MTHQSEARDLGRLEGKMDSVVAGLKNISSQMDGFIKYQHERNHALANGIDHTRGEIIVAQRELLARVDARDAERKADLVSLEDRLVKIESARKSDRAFLAGVSAAISAAITALGLGWKLGGLP